MNDELLPIYTYNQKPKYLTICMQKQRLTATDRKMPPRTNAPGGQSINPAELYKRVPNSTQKELQRALNILKDTKTNHSDWPKRIEAINQLKMVLVQVAEFFENHPNIDEEEAVVMSQLMVKGSTSGVKDADDGGARRVLTFTCVSYVQRMVQPVIVQQLNDLRSTVAKEACNFVVWLAREFPQEFSQHSVKQAPPSDHSIAGGVQPPAITTGGGNGVRYFRDDALFKLISSGNKTLSDMGNQTIVEILEFNSSINKILPHLCASIHSKNALVRLRTAQYFSIVMNNSSVLTIETNSELIELFLINATDDQNQEVRNQGRFCFTIYRHLLPDQSTLLLMHGIKSNNVRKQIIQELGLDLAQLAQELNRIEHQDKRPQVFSGRETMPDDGVSGSDATMAAKTPIREKVQKLTNRYDGAKTPEQFMRVLQSQNRAKSPLVTGFSSKSPLPGSEAPVPKKTALRTKLPIFDNRIRTDDNEQYKTQLHSSRVNHPGTGDAPNLIQHDTMQQLQTHRDGTQQRLGYESNPKGANVSLREQLMDQMETLTRMQSQDKSRASRRGKDRIIENTEESLNQDTISQKGVNRSKSFLNSTQKAQAPKTPKRQSLAAHFQTQSVLNNAMKPTVSDPPQKVGQPFSQYARQTLMPEANAPSNREIQSQLQQSLHKRTKKQPTTATKHVALDLSDLNAADDDEPPDDPECSSAVPIQSNTFRSQLSTRGQEDTVGYKHQKFMRQQDPSTAKGNIEAAAKGPTGPSRAHKVQSTGTIAPKSIRTNHPSDHKDDFQKKRSTSKIGKGIGNLGRRVKEAERVQELQPEQPKQTNEFPQQMYYLKPPEAFSPTKIGNQAEQEYFSYKTPLKNEGSRRALASQAANQANSTTKTSTRQADQSPLPLGKSPRPVAASPRFDGLFFNSQTPQPNGGALGPISPSERARKAGQDPNLNQSAQRRVSSSRILQHQALLARQAKANAKAQETTKAGQPVSKQKRTTVKRAVVELDDSYEEKESGEQQSMDQRSNSTNQQFDQKSSITGISSTAQQQPLSSSNISDRKTQFLHFQRNPLSNQLPLQGQPQFPGQNTSEGQSTADALQQFGDGLAGVAQRFNERGDRDQMQEEQRQVVDRQNQAPVNDGAGNNAQVNPSQQSQLHSLRSFRASATAPKARTPRSMRMLNKTKSKAHDVTNSDKADCLTKKTNDQTFGASQSSKRASICGSDQPTPQSMNSEHLQSKQPFVQQYFEIQNNIQIAISQSDADPDQLLQQIEAIRNLLWQCQPLASPADLATVSPLQMLTLQLLDEFILRRGARNYQSQQVIRTFAEILQKIYQQVSHELMQNDPKVIKQFQDQLLIKIWHSHFDTGYLVTKDMATLTTESIIEVIKLHNDHKQHHDILVDLEALTPVQEALLAQPKGLTSSKQKIESIIRIFGSWILNKLVNAPYECLLTPFILEYCQGSLEKIELAEEAGTNENISTRSDGTSSMNLQITSRLNADASRSCNASAKQIIVSIIECVVMEHQEGLREWMGQGGQKVARVLRVIQSIRPHFQSRVEDVIGDRQLAADQPMQAKDANQQVQWQINGSLQQTRPGQSASQTCDATQPPLARNFQRMDGQNIESNDSPTLEALEPPKPAQLPTDMLHGFENEFTPINNQTVPPKQIGLSYRHAADAQSRAHSKIDTASKTRPKLSGSPIITNLPGANSSGYGGIAIADHKSPPRSQVYHHVSRPGYQAMTPQEDELLSLSINGEILQQAEPVTSIVNYGESEAKAKFPAKPSQVQPCILDATIIIEAPHHIRLEHEADEVKEVHQQPSPSKKRKSKKANGNLSKYTYRGLQQSAADQVSEQC